MSEKLKLISYQWDPSINDAREVGSISQQQQDTTDAPSQEELTRHRVQQTAEGLADRSRHTATPGDTQDLANEASLYQLQKELSVAHETGNHLRAMELEDKVTAMASALVGDVFPATRQEEEVAYSEDFAEEYKNQNPDLDLDLAYAGEVMGSDLAESINEVITDNSDQLSQVAALEMVKQLRADPSHFISREESTGVSELLEAEIASEFGTDLAHAVSVLGNSVARNVITPQQAIRTAAQDPDLQNCIRSLVASGRLRIAL